MKQSPEKNFPPRAKQYSFAQEPEEQALISGTLSRITFRNKENGFSVCRLISKDTHINSGNQITVVGILPDSIYLGSEVKAHGSWTSHPRFGRQFKATLIVEQKPTDKTAIERYLSSGPVKGFGPVLAKRVVEAFGVDALEIIDDTPERLLEVQGIGEEKLKTIKEQWLTNKSEREVLTFLFSHGITQGLARKIHKQYGDNTIAVIKKNPYLLAKHVWGIGFQTADTIAHSFGIKSDSEIRIQAGLAYALKKATDDGHCYLPKNDLIEYTARLLQLSALNNIDEVLQNAIQESEIIDINGKIYLPELNDSESSLAKLLADHLLATPIPLKNIGQEQLRTVAESSYVDAQNAKKGEAHKDIIKLSPQQSLGLELTMSSGLVVITGGPGCGKTTLVRAISNLFRRASLRIKLAAPTGRAAQRLTEVCSIEASTIHRLLRFEPYGSTFFHNESNPLEADAFIIDECSMVDISLASSLFRAIPKGARIVIVGDADQLPSVGPGLFLHDVLALEKVPRVKLTTIFRRHSESSISQVAHEINRARVPTLPTYGTQSQADAFIYPITDALSGAQAVEHLVVDAIPKHFGFKMDDITVLSPMNRGDLGVQSLNIRLQNRLVPRTPKSPYVQVAKLEFRIGDKVCQRVNNYTIISGGVFNGDQGEVIAIDPDSQTVYVRLWDGREVPYKNKDLNQIDLAYAITIHRSQGSEVPVVILALHESHTILLERQLIYTAVTRAKKLLVIVGTKRALSTAVSKMRSKRRFTFLQERTEAALREGAQ